MQRILSPNELKVCLKLLIQSGGRGPLRNCMPINAYMKLRRKISKPRFVIDENALRTVYRIFLSAFHDLTILKILKSLKDLSTVSTLEPALRNSKSPTITMIASKSLKLSLTQFLNPIPTSLSTISAANKHVNVELAVSMILLHVQSMSQCSIAMKVVLRIIKMMINMLNGLDSTRNNTLALNFINNGYQHLFFFNSLYY